VEVDEQAEDGGIEAPDRHERLHGNLVGDDRQPEGQEAEDVDAAVAGEQSADAGGAQVEHHDAGEVEVWGVVEDAVLVDVDGHWGADQEVEQVQADCQSDCLEADEGRSAAAVALHHQDGERHPDRPEHVGEQREDVGRPGLQTG
jgi:hypothetical protein